MQIEDLLRNMHRLADAQRYTIGTHIEEWAREVVNSRLNCTKWEKTTDKADRLNKQDWIAKGASGNPLYAQFKGRATGNDILVCVWQPFLGFDEDDTKDGRDMVETKIHYYVTYPPMAEEILVSRAQDVKAACEKLKAEIKRQKNPDFPFYSKEQCDENGPRSYGRPPCCQLRYKIEEGKGYRNGQPKVLAFLPPQLMNPRRIKVDPADFRAYMEEKLKPRQAHFEFRGAGTPS